MCDERAIPAGNQLTIKYLVKVCCGNNKWVFIVRAMLEWDSFTNRLSNFKVLIFLPGCFCC